MKSSSWPNRLGFFATLLSLFLMAQLQARRIDYPRYVSVKLEGQFGNQLFQIATAYAYALDHQRPLVIPDLYQEGRWGVPHHREVLFEGRIEQHKMKRAPSVWKQPGPDFTPIPYYKRLLLHGFFQTELYFKHRRPEIQGLFRPPKSLLQKILRKYPILNHPEHTVGIQIRDYRREYPSGEYHPTHNRHFYEQAISKFPRDTVFLVTSNHRKFAEECVGGLAERIVYLETEDYLEDFYALSLCGSFIISNSSFGWWAAWLSDAPHKRVIAPKPWFAKPFDVEKMEKDLFAEGMEALCAEPISPHGMAIAR